MKLQFTAECIIVAFLLHDEIRYFVAPEGTENWSIFISDTGAFCGALVISY